MRLHGRKFLYVDHFHKNEDELITKVITGKVKKTKVRIYRSNIGKVKMRTIITGKKQWINKKFVYVYGEKDLFALVWNFDIWITNSKEEIPALAEKFVNVFHIPVDWKTLVHAYYQLV